MSENSSLDFTFNPNYPNMYYAFFDNCEVPEEPKKIFTGNKIIMKSYTHYFSEIKSLDSSASAYDGYDLVYSEFLPGSELKYTLRMSDVLDGDFKKGVSCHLSGEPGIRYVYVNTVAVEVEEYIHNWTDEISYPFAGQPMARENNINLEKIKLNKMYNMIKLK